MADSWSKEERERLGYTEQWLREQYHDKKRSMNDIAKELGKDPKTVLRWFRAYGIETRKRGYASSAYSFKKGEPSAFKGHKHKQENRELFRQMRLADGRVPYLKNGEHWLKQPGIHSPAWRGGVTPERQAVYSSERWKNAVKEVWRRDNATCKRCGKKQIDRQFDKFAIHHIYPFSDKPYLRTNPDNLVLLCRDCHLFVHSKKNVNHEFIPTKAILPEWIAKKGNGE